MKTENNRLSRKDMAQLTLAGLAIYALFFVLKNLTDLQTLYERIKRRGAT